MIQFVGLAFCGQFIAGERDLGIWGSTTCCLRRCRRGRCAGLHILRRRADAGSLDASCLVPMMLPPPYSFLAWSSDFTIMREILFYCLGSLPAYTRTPQPFATSMRSARLAIASRCFVTNGRRFLIQAKFHKISSCLSGGEPRLHLTMDTTSRRSSARGKREGEQH